MGGFGSGRPRKKPYGDFTLTEKGKFNLNSSKRFKTFAYKQKGEKFYGIKDTFTGEIYKRINEEAYDYILRRFAVESEDKVLSRLDIYTKEGLYDRAETARGNVESALLNYFDTDASFRVEDKDITLNEILQKLQDLKGDPRWVDFATRNSDLIDSFFIGYRSEMARAPSKFAGTTDKNSAENIENEQDQIASDNYEKMFSFVEDLVKTFKI